MTRGLNVWLVFRGRSTCHSPDCRLETAVEAASDTSVLIGAYATRQAARTVAQEYRSHAPDSTVIVRNEVVHR